MFIFNKIESDNKYEIGHIEAKIKGLIEEQTNFEAEACSFWISEL